MPGHLCLSLGSPRANIEHRSLGAEAVLPPVESVSHTFPLRAGGLRARGGSLSACGRASACAPCPSARLALLVDASPRCEQVRVSRGALLLAASSLPHFDVLRLGAAAAARVPAVHTDLLKGRHCAHRPRCNSTSRGWYTTTPESTSKSTSTSATSLLRTPRGSRVCSSDAILFLFRSG